MLLPGLRRSSAARALSRAAAALGRSCLQAPATLDAGGLAALLADPLRALASPLDVSEPLEAALRRLEAGVPARAAVEAAPRAGERLGPGRLARRAAGTGAGVPGGAPSATALAGRGGGGATPLPRPRPAQGSAADLAHLAEEAARQVVAARTRRFAAPGGAAETTAPGAPRHAEPGLGRWAACVRGGEAAAARALDPRRPPVDGARALVRRAWPDVAAPTADPRAAPPRVPTAPEAPPVRGEPVPAAIARPPPPEWRALAGSAQRPVADREGHGLAALVSWWEQRSEATPGAGAERHMAAPRPGSAALEAIDARLLEAAEDAPAPSTEAFRHALEQVLLSEARRHGLTVEED